MSLSPRFLIIKTGSTFPELAAQRGDFEDWIVAGMGIAPADVQVVDVQAGAPLPALATPRAVVVTGSHAMVTDRDAWSEATAIWLRDAVARRWPILGICYGHQLLAHACGGLVGPGLEMGRTAATRTPESGSDSLLGALPERYFTLNGHFQAVLEPPSGATVLATTARDPYHAFRVGACAWGIQWHPEIDVPIIATYIRRSRVELEAAGMNVDAVLADLAPTPTAATVLKRFVAVAGTQLTLLDQASMQDKVLL